MQVLPRGPYLPPLAQSAAWVFRPIPFLEGCRRRFGDTFTMQLAGLPPLVVLSKPSDIKEVFTGDPEVFHAGSANMILKPILGRSSLLLLDGERHMKERRMMMPAFHGERMQAYGRVMQEAADRSIDRWPTGTPFPLHQRMQDVTCSAPSRAGSGRGRDAFRGGERPRDRERGGREAEAEARRREEGRRQEEEDHQRRTSWKGERRLTPRPATTIRSSGGRSS